MVHRVLFLFFTHSTDAPCAVFHPPESSSVVLRIRWPSSETVQRPQPRRTSKTAPSTSTHHRFRSLRTFTPWNSPKLFNNEDFSHNQVIRSDKHTANHNDIAQRHPWFSSNCNAYLSVWFTNSRKTRASTAKTLPKNCFNLCVYLSVYRYTPRSQNVSPFKK